MEKEAGQYHSPEELGLENLPFTIAHPLSKSIEMGGEKKYASETFLLLDFFERTTEYVSILLMTMLKRTAQAEGADSARSKKIMAVLVPVVKYIDRKRPLSFGDWVNEMLTRLLICAKEVMPEDEFVKPLVEHLLIGRGKNQNVLLGNNKNLKSIVALRNNYRGHSNLHPDIFYVDICATLRERALTVLRGLQGFAGMNFIAALPDGTAVEMKGTTPRSLEGILAEDELTPGHYYIESGDARYDMFPLISVGDKDSVFLFQSLGDGKAFFVTSSELSDRKEVEDYNEALNSYFKAIWQPFDVAREINIEAVEEQFISESRGYLADIYKARKYNRELFVERYALTEARDAFYASDKLVFPLIGEAGQGKTNQLCHWAEQMTENGDAVMIVDCSDFAEISLAGKFRAMFNYSERKKIDKLVDRIHKVAVEAGRYVYFFFDAVNECFHYKADNALEEHSDGEAPPLMLYRDILSLLAKPEYTNFKTIFTCRTYTWKNLLQTHTGDFESVLFNSQEDEKYNVSGFNDEEVERAYKTYQELFQMTTSYDDVDPRTRIRLKDPLVLKFVCTNYLGRSLSADNDDYTSISLFSKMLADIRASYAGRKQCAIIKEAAGHILRGFLEGESEESISMSQLQAAYKDSTHPLHHLAGMIFRSDGLSIAYAELLNKPERPVLYENVGGDSSNAKLQFVYERFLEYMLAVEFIEGYRCNIADGRSPIPAQVYVDALNGAIDNVVFMGCMRNALLIDYIATNNYNTIIELITDHSDNYKVSRLITQCMDALIRENFESRIYEIEERLLRPADLKTVITIQQFNGVVKKIESNNADSSTIARYKELSAKLTSLIKLRNIAVITIINGLLLTEYFQKGLYKRDVLDLLWRLMEDDITEVRNNACIYTYYLSNKHFTLNHTPLKENLTDKIVAEMYRIIKTRSLIGNMARRKARQRFMTFFETATRLIVILIIDALMIDKDRDRVARLLDEIRSILSYCTYRYALVRMLMPFFQMLLRKQITFQSDYCNNAIEYANFWDDNCIAPQGAPETWTRDKLPTLMSHLDVHKQYGQRPDPEAFAERRSACEALMPVLASTYHTGDSFSYFASERLLVILGVTDWEIVAPLIRKFFDKDSYRTDEWFDYSQMSLLYVLYQIAVNSDRENTELLEYYERECRDWTERCRGLYQARSSHKANAVGKYKRNVVTWYCVAYCAHQGDNVVHQGQTRCVPLVYDMVDKAVENSDRELLLHLIENITELVSDAGLYQTAFSLIKYIMTKFDSQEKIDAIDAVEVERSGIYRKKLVEIIANFFSAAKNYYPAAVDNFLKTEVVGLAYPGVRALRDELLNYNPAGETLSDLLTHKFGNFLMWSLLNEEAVIKFSVEAMNASVEADNCFKWYDNVVRILFRHLCGIKL